METTNFMGVKPATTGSKQGYRLQNLCVCILAWVYCQSIPNPTPLGEYHRVTKV